MFGFLCSKVKFQQDIDDAAILYSPFIDGFQKMQGINRLYKRDIRQNQFELICLEVAYKMPLNIGWHLRHFGSQLLRPVLSKDPLPGIIRFHQPLHRMELRHRNKLHPGGQSLIQSIEIVLYHENRTDITGTVTGTWARDGAAVTFALSILNTSLSHGKSQ